MILEQFNLSGKSNGKVRAPIWQESLGRPYLQSGAGLRPQWHHR